MKSRYYHFFHLNNSFWSIKKKCFLLWWYVKINLINAYTDYYKQKLCSIALMKWDVSRETHNKFDNGFVVLWDDHGYWFCEVQWLTQEHPMAKLNTGQFWKFKCLQCSKVDCTQHKILWKHGITNFFYLNNSLWSIKKKKKRFSALMIC